MMRLQRGLAKGGGRGLAGGGERGEMVEQFPMHQHTPPSHLLDVAAFQSMRKLSSNYYQSEF